MVAHTRNLCQLLPLCLQNTVKTAEGVKQALCNRVSVSEGHGVVEQHFKQLVGVKNTASVGQQLCSHSATVAVMDIFVGYEFFHNSLLLARFRTFSL